MHLMHEMMVAWQRMIKGTTEDLTVLTILWHAVVPSPSA